MEYRFIIERASYLHERNKKPCQEAKKVWYYHEWITETTRRKTKEFIFVVKFENLDDLMTFVKKYGSVIINLNPIIYHKELANKGLGKIIIYDDYIE